VPRDRNDSFEPAIVPKKTRRLGNIAIGVDVEGRKHAMGCWIRDSELPPPIPDAR
jgi:transposase-like protein